MSQNLVVTSVVTSSNTLQFQDRDSGQGNLEFAAAGVTNIPAGAVINDAGNSAFQVKGVTVSPLEVYSKEFTASLAQINAGLTLIAAVSGITLVPVFFYVKCVGAFAALTDIRLSDTNASPVDIATIAQAQATNGAIFTPAGASGLTIGAGFGVPLTASKGLQIRQTGSAGTTATGVVGVVLYRMV